MNFSNFRNCFLQNTYEPLLLNLPRNFLGVYLSIYLLDEKSAGVWKIFQVTFNMSSIYSKECKAKRYKVNFDYFCLIDDDSITFLIFKSLSKILKSPIDEIVLYVPFRWLFQIILYLSLHNKLFRELIDYSFLEYNLPISHLVVFLVLRNIFDSI